MLALLRSKGIQRPDVLKFPLFFTRRQYPTQSIQTLDPAKLRSKRQKIHDISSTKTVFVGFRSIGAASVVQFRFKSTKDPKNITQDIPFPERTRGVFYYHIDPQLPSISGGIRFRLCNSLKTFDQGQDLQTATGKHWNIPLLRISRLDSFKPLARYLIDEGMVEIDAIQDLRQLKPPSRFTGLYLYHISQPVVIDLEQTALTLHLITRKSYSSPRFYSPFYNSFKGYNPYSGLLKVRLELSTLEEHKKKGPTLVLRILEILSPVQRVSPLGAGPYIEPVVNSLAMRRTSGGVLKPWAYPIDKRCEGVKWKEFLVASGHLLS